MKYNKIIKNIANILVISGIVLGAIFGFSVKNEAYAASGQEIISQPIHNLPESDTGLYIVQLKDPSVSMYMGGIQNLAATSPQSTGERKLNPKAPASQAYASYLETEQQNLIDNMQATFGHPVEVQFFYQYALNAVAVRISHDEALQAFELPGVNMVYPDVINELDTDMGPTLIGAPSIWNGDTIGGVETKGEGIVIGMIDSGINSQHPSFAEEGDDGFAIINPYGDDVFHGWCVANPSFCNNKLIGGYGLNPNGGNPEDTDGHGSHTASTAGGNALDAEFEVGGQPFTRPISGVAPHSNIVAYKVCNPGCPSSSSVQAVNLAIGTDDVDVINFSISGSSNPWNDSVDVAFLNAFAAGIFVSASAGNAGPGAGTVAHVGPWNSTVAASTHSRIIADTLDVTATSGNLTGLKAVPGSDVLIPSDITGPILFAGDVDLSNVLACNAFAAGSFTGKIGLAQRGSCDFEVKVSNLHNAGATAVVIYNNAGGPPSTMGWVTNPFVVPAVMITLDEGLDVVDLITGDDTAEVTIHSVLAVFIDPIWNDIMAGFSSRGPSLFELVKPDYTAPGVNVLAAYAASGADPLQYAFLQGTSMSSPHSTGSSALMMALRPTWSVAEIRSAMNSTANPVPVKDSDGVTPADPWDMGSGRLDLYGAGNAGLVMDETAVNYQAANPSQGGDPKTLNQPSMVDYACMGTCTWTRTVKSVLSTPETWNVTTSSGADWEITMVPSQFTLVPGESVELSITADVTTAPAGSELFGDVTLTPGTGFTTRLPVVVRVVATANPIISVDPTEITSVQAAELVTIPMTISNTGEGELNWTLSDLASDISWSESFDSYPKDTSMHGLNGWKGWANDPNATGYTRDLFSRSSPNSVEIAAASDLVHEYTGYTSDVWAYTAWQYIPSTCTGEQYFILLNQYDDGGVTNNWSTQVNFNCGTSIIANEGPAGGTLPMTKDQWTEIRVEIDMDNDQQTFYYGNNLLFQGSWTDGMTGDGILNIGAVDLFANSASAVYYDDISIGQLTDAPWLSTDPTSGTTAPGGTSDVDVLLDGTGMTPGTYVATLYAESDDPVTPVIAVPVTIIIQLLSDLAIVKTDSADPVKTGEQFTYTLTISTTLADATGVIVVDTLPEGVTLVSAPVGCVEVDGVVSCDVGDLAVGSTMEISLVVTAPNVVGTITNTAVVNSNEVIDPNTANNTAIESTDVIPGMFNIYLPLIIK